MRPSFQCKVLAEQRTHRRETRIMVLELDDLKRASHEQTRAIASGDDDEWPALSMIKLQS